MYIILGWVNVALVAVQLLPFIVRRLNKYFIKSSALTKQINKYRVLHRILGGLLLVGTIIHGVLALGVLRLHTGTLLGAAAVLTVLIGAAFLVFKKKWLLALHRISALLVILMVLVHLIFPYAVYYIFGV